ncbi:MAG: hypothetical protein Q8M24_11590 [Pseudolabrys sp.]|nr:hypothetical protein [Pseudolabrys sp.]
MLSSTFAFAQAPTASSVGTGGSSAGSATVGSGGSAAAGGTSASTLGLGAKSGDSQSIGSAGTAAAVDGKVSSQTKLSDDKAMSKAKAQDGGTWSKSQTKTKIKDDVLSSRTKSMAHEPGGPPAKSTTRTSVPVGQ